MIKFSASEAALEGFRLTRERPGTIFGWGVVYAICMFVIGRLMLVDALSGVTRTITIRNTLNSSPGSCLSLPFASR